MILAIVIGLIAVALVFDFINGFHDAANSIATVVSTRVLSPPVAVAWAAFFNFIAAAPALFGGQLKVANTMGTGIIKFGKLQHDQHLVLAVIFAALLGAIIWNLLTWWWGLPSSSSHALAGGMIGAALPVLHLDGLIFGGIAKIAAFIVLSPVIGMIFGSLDMVLASWLVRKQTPARVDRWFRRLQLLSAAVFSYSHGTNDAQKVMGIITVVLYGTIWASPAGASAAQHFHIPFWVVLLCNGAIGLGTMFGGWRIVKTMGHKLTKLQPIGGFCAETGGGVTILGVSAFGIPVSTTHTITGAIVGVGATRGTRAVRWGVAGRIVWAWLLTIPMSALFAALSYLVVRLIHGPFLPVP